MLLDLWRRKSYSQVGFSGDVSSVSLVLIPPGHAFPANVPGFLLSRSSTHRECRR